MAPQIAWVRRPNPVYSDRIEFDLIGRQA